METPTSTRELVGDEPRDEERRSEREGSEASSARPGDATDTREESRARTDEPRDGERTGTASFARAARRPTTRPSCCHASRTPSSRPAGRRSRPGSSTSRARPSSRRTSSWPSLMKRLAEGFANERERLEGQWGRGEDVSTEDLRVTLQRYRGFFQRLLSA